MVRQIVPLFFTTNIPGTVAYYQEKLGFECLGTWQDPPVYAIMARDRQALHFRCAAPPTPNPNKYPDELLDAYLFVEDADALYGELAARGVEFTRELGDMSALIWSVPDSGKTLFEEARKLLAWEDIQDESTDLHLDETQRRQLTENLGKARRDLNEAVWRTYKTVMLLGKDNAIRTVDLGLVHSSAADSLVGFIVNRLKQDGDISDGISPKFLARNWSGAHKEWSTKAVRDVVFASPVFPRLLNPDLIRDTIARGVSNSILAYVGKKAGGGYDPFLFGASMGPQEVEISEDTFVITAEAAQAYKDSAATPTPAPGSPTLFTEMMANAPAPNQAPAAARRRRPLKAAGRLSRLPDNPNRCVGPGRCLPRSG